jgi:hypothetical protein
MSIDVAKLEYLKKLTPDTYIWVISNDMPYRVRVSDILGSIILPDAVSLGLGNVNNTPDSLKPVSKYQREALDKKSDKGHSHELSSVLGLEDYIWNKMQTDEMRTIVAGMVNHHLADIGKINLKFDQIEGLTNYLNSVMVDIVSERIATHLAKHDMLLKAVAVKLGIAIDTLVDHETKIDNKSDIDHTHVMDNITDSPKILSGIHTRIQEVDDEIDVRPPQW